MRSTTPAFFLLPEELLTGIIDACIQYTSDSGSKLLKDLRLVHPRFGNLKRLKSELFYKIYLRPDPRKLQAREEIANIAPHVLHVIFEPATLRRSTCQALNFSVMKARQAHERAVYELVNNGAVADMSAVLRPMVQLRSVTVTQAKVQSGKDVAVPTGDALLKLAIQSLTTAGISIQDFFIEHHPHSDFDWVQRLPGWHDFPVYNLKKLHFHPVSDTREEIAWQYLPDVFGQAPPPIVAGLEPDSTLTDLLQRCSSSLQELSCCCPALVFGQSWQSYGILQLKALHKLELSDCLVDGPFFGEWLLACLNLDNVALTRMRPRASDRLPDWRPIFDAIRAHKKRMTVLLNEVDVWAGLRWRLTLIHHTSHPAESLTACFPPKLCASLKNYMTDLREWISEDEQHADVGWA